MWNDDRDGKFGAVELGLMHFRNRNVCIVDILVQDISSATVHVVYNCQFDSDGCCASRVLTERVHGELDVFDQAVTTKNLS
jgi:hypothetical protein